MALQIHSGKPQTSCHPHREQMPQKDYFSFFGRCYSFQELLVSSADAMSSTTRQAHWFPSLFFHRLVDAFAPHLSKRAVSEAGPVVGVGIPQEARQAWSFLRAGATLTFRMGRLRMNEDSQPGTKGKCTDGTGRMEAGGQDDQAPEGKVIRGKAPWCAP